MIRARYDNQQIPREQLRTVDRQSLVRPNRNLGPAWLAKMKTPTPGKFENVAGNFAAKIDNFRARLFQLRLIKDNQRRACPYLSGFFLAEKPAGHPPIAE